MDALRGALAALLVTMLLAPSAKADITLNFGLYASDKPTEVVRQFRPVLSFLERDIGARLGEKTSIQIQVSRGYEEGIENLVAGRVDFARFGPASYVLAKQANPALSVHASDWDDETVETARATIANHGIDIDVRIADARSLRTVSSHSFDYIVSDPPYGVRLGKRTSIRGLYADLLKSFEESLADGGRVALVVLKYRAFLKALEPTSLRIVDERVIESSGLHPRIFILAQKAQGTLRS